MMRLTSVRDLRLYSEPYKAGYYPNAALTFLPILQSAEERIAAMQRNTLLLPPRSRNILTAPEFGRVKASLKK